MRPDRELSSHRQGKPFFSYLVRSCAVVALLMAVLSPALHAQFGPPAPQGSGPKLPAPTAFPPSGTFPTTESVTLLDAEPGATIYYTLDGSAPTAKSLAYDPTQLLFVGGFYEGERGIKAGYTIRAVAIKEGHTNSDISNFIYTIDRRDRTAYVSEEILPGVRMVRDSDNDKMFLVKGTNKFALIDSGLGRGDLKSYLSQFTGGLPIEVIFTHSHGDHIGQADQFIRESVEHIGEGDRPGLERLLKSRGVSDDVIAKNAVAAHDGDRIDLGDRALTIYTTPGHTPGSIAILDEQNGYLFTGDSFGSNSATIPDALWMQGSQAPLDLYLATIKSARSKFGGKVKYLMTGHNDRPLEGETYLDNLETALQSLMDKGDEVLVPSYRPVGLRQVVVGDRFKDPNWIAINVNRDRYLPAPVDKIARLMGISIEGLKMTPAFSPEVKDYTVEAPRGAKNLKVTAYPTSSRSTITVNGSPVTAGKPSTVKLPTPKLTVDVKSPDGTQTNTFTVTVSRK